MKKQILLRLNKLQQASAYRASSFTRDLGFQHISVLNGSNTPNSKIVEKKTSFFIKILSILKQEGYIRYFIIENQGRSVSVTVFLKYSSQGNPGIRTIHSRSTSGRRLFVSVGPL